MGNSSGSQTVRLDPLAKTLPQKILILQFIMVTRFQSGSRNKNNSMARSHLNMRKYSKGP